MQQGFKPWAKVLLPILVLALALAAGRYIVTHKPEAKRSSQQQARAVQVEAVRLKSQRYQVQLKSYGVVQPRTESQLVAQVSGQVEQISERFREGAFFEAGDTLLQIDRRDYQAAVEVAEANLIQARALLKEEKARSEQALRDWKRLGQGEPTELVLREPQLAAAKAAIASAKAQLSTAKLNLDRTRIAAPYAGRVLEKQVDLGQVVNSGSGLASIYAVDYVEVRLPLNNRQLEFIDLPEQYRGGQLTTEAQPRVTLNARVGRNLYQWQGQIVRVEGAIDSRSRQLFVVAQIEDPYSLGPQGNPPLKVGQFVEAQIAGIELDNVFVLPRSAISQDQRLLMIEQGALVARQVEPLWSDEQVVVIGEGLKAGELVNLTPVGRSANGTRVSARIDGQPLAASLSPSQVVED